MRKMNNISKNKKVVSQKVIQKIKQKQKNLHERPFVRIWGGRTICLLILLFGSVFMGCSNDKIENSYQTIKYTVDQYELNTLKSFIIIKSDDKTTVTIEDLKTGKIDHYEIPKGIADSFWNNVNQLNILNMKDDYNPAICGQSATFHYCCGQSSQEFRSKTLTIENSKNKNIKELLKLLHDLIKYCDKLTPITEDSSPWT